MFVQGPGESLIIRGLKMGGRSLRPQHFADGCGKLLETSQVCGKDANDT
jgi:hypothetical protein